jgi:hypothetical protein
MLQSQTDRIAFQALSSGLMQIRDGFCSWRAELILLLAMRLTR